MEVKCEYCGSLIPDNVSHCPNCGAVNENMSRAAENVPQTIEELAQWYKDRNLPPYETTRFFIGINYKEPKAFGIYREDDRFIVYKNKADGTRVIRYAGKDEDYAVNELYLKLKSEIINHKSRLLEKNNTTEEKVSEKTKNISSLKSLGFDKSWLKAVIKLLGILAGGVIGIVAFVRAIEGIAWLVIAIGIIIALLVLFLGTKVFRKNKKPVIFISLALLLISFIVSAIVGRNRFIPRYYWYNEIPYVWYDNEYYLFDYEEESYEHIPEEEVPEVLVSIPAEYQVDKSGFPSDKIPEFSSGPDNDSWIDSINFFSDNDDDRDYHWDSNDNWDAGNTNWDSDW